MRPFYTLPHAVQARSTRYLGALLLLATSFSVQAQTGGVGIGTTAPDASAALDIVSTDKGLLLPRVPAATAIASPAAGLLVYQTGAPAGFYYNSGTAAAPNWQQLATAGSSGTGDNLGNHTATQNLNLGSNLLTGTGGYVGSAIGLGVRVDGGLDLGQNTAGNNLFVGYGAGASNVVSQGRGVQNQFIGYQAGQANTSGYWNQFSGYQSGNHNTSGGNNTFGGYQSGFYNTTGFSNTFNGYKSGYSNNGTQNTFYGFYSGGDNSTGNQNTFIGSQTGIYNATGSNNTALGSNSGPVSSGFGPAVVLNNATAVGANVGLTTSNTLILGNGANVGIGTSEPAEKLVVSDGNVLLQSSSSAFVGIRSYGSVLGWMNLGVAATPQSYSNLSQAGDAVLMSNRSLILASTFGGSVVVGTGPYQEQERLRVTSAGNVGIGTATPGQRLEVAGNVQISGTGSGLLFPDGTTQTTAAMPSTAQTLALSGQDLSLSGGNTVTLPTQQLSISGNTISLTNGGSVAVPAALGDNLGNHTATTNIGLNNNWLSNAPGNANGLRIDNAGNVGIGGAPGATGLHVRTAEKASISSVPGVFLSGGLTGNPNIELRGTNGSAYLDFVNNLTTDYDARILSGGTGLAFYTGGGSTPRLLLAPGGGVGVGSLAGTGTRMVTAAADGTLSTQALPSGADNLGSHTATQALNLATFPLVGNGGTTGLTIASTGAVTTAGAFTAAGTTKLSALGNGSTTRMVTAAADGTLAAQALPVDTDAQQLTIIGSTISLTNGGSVTVPATPGDNLGNHTATQNLDLADKLLVGSGGTAGLAISADGNVGLGTTPAAPATQKLDVRGNVRLGNDVNGGTGAGPAVEWVGPGINSDPVGIYRLNPANDQSELRVVVGDVPDPNDRFSVGRMDGTSTEGGIPGGTFTPNFTVRADGNVGVGTAIPTSTLQVAGSVAAPIRTLNSGVIAATDYTVLVTGNVSLPFPSSLNTGRLYHLLNGSAGTPVVTGTLRDAGTTSSISSFTLGTGSGVKGITVQSDGTQWWILTRE